MTCILQMFRLCSDPENTTWHMKDLKDLKKANALKLCLPEGQTRSNQTRDSEVSVPWKRYYAETQQTLEHLSELNLYILSHPSEFLWSFFWQMSVICVIKESITDSFTMLGSSKCDEPQNSLPCVKLSAHFCQQMNL